MRWSAACHRDVSAEVVASPDYSIFEITMTMRDPKTPLCTDTYMLSSLSGTIAIEHFPVAFDSVRKVQYNVSASELTAAGLFDLKNNGIRVFSFQSSWSRTLSDIIAVSLL